ncbi:MAG: oxidoreductase [Solibacterales bacterium]|nr:oxidoreductase [Bryobacterales bacterium]
MPKSLTRRSFVSGAPAGAYVLGASASTPRSFNDKVTVGMIAVGARAQELLEGIKMVEGVEIVAICDAYKGRLERAVERSEGRAKIYDNYRKIFDDDTIDAVTIATPDHWHKQQVIEALEAGKDVYCEKPLTYTVSEGLEIAEAVKRTGKLLQIGSQGMSSDTQHKAREIIRSGRLGRVTMIRASYNRNSSSGAWLYPIPPDASPETVDWESFLGSAPKHHYDLERFFRWRCYRDYSGGIATDLFVHLCTTIHFLMDAKMPATVAARGNLYRWKESRDVPDTLNAILEYPEGFTVNLSSTFNNDYTRGQSFQVLGTEGTLEIGFRDLKFIPGKGRVNNRWIVKSWPRQLEQDYHDKIKAHAAALAAANDVRRVKESEEYKETGRNATLQHLDHFFDSVRSRKPTVQDVWAGHRAAACAHLINDSVENDRIVHWDFDKELQRL